MASDATDEGHPAVRERSVSKHYEAIPHELSDRRETLAVRAKIYSQRLLGVVPTHFLSYKKWEHWGTEKTEALRR